MKKTVALQKNKIKKIIGNTAKRGRRGGRLDSAEEIDRNSSGGKRPIRKRKEGKRTSRRLTAKGEEAENTASGTRKKKALGQGEERDIGMKGHNTSKRFGH